jgi:hypothetical protein
MARENQQNGHTADAEEAHQSAYAMMSGAQERIRAGVGKAAEVMPDAVAGAQVAARESQRRLDEMSDQTLLAGASFSLGLSIGLFVNGASRLLVALTLVPAAAMLTTLMGRGKASDTDEAATTSKSRRASRAAEG